MLALYVQGSAKRWALGCMNSAYWLPLAVVASSRNLGSLFSLSLYSKILSDKSTHQFRDQWYIFLRWSELRHAVDVLEERIVRLPAQK